MRVQVLGSSSKGNSYILESCGNKLIVDAGVSFKEVQKALNFNFNDVVGALVTHSHLDHCKAVKDLAVNGINVYMSKGTADEIAIKSHRIKLISHLKQFDIDNFTVLPFDVQHDTAEPLGFIIQDSKTREKMLFVTDTAYLKYRFNNLNYIFIECNYIKDVAYQNIANGTLNKNLYNRTLQSHFSLDNLMEFFKANDITNVRKIVLIHLSDTNSDYRRIKLEIEKITKKEVIIAEKDMFIDLDLYEF